MNKIFISAFLIVFFNLGLFSQESQNNKSTITVEIPAEISVPFSAKNIKTAFSEIDTSSLSYLKKLDEAMKFENKENDYDKISKKWEELAAQNDTLKDFASSRAAEIRDYARYMYDTENYKKDKKEVLSSKIEKDYKDLSSFLSMDSIKNSDKDLFVRQFMKKYDSIIFDYYPDYFKKIKRYLPIPCITNDRKYSLCYRSGEQLFDFICPPANTFTYDTIKIICGQRVGYLNREKQVIADPSYYEDMLDISENAIAVKKFSKWGFINTNGNKIIPFKYEYAGSFHGGLAAVKQKGKYGFIDKLGKKKIDFIYDYAEDFICSKTPAGKDGKYGLIDKYGKEIIPFNYQSLSYSCSDRYVKVKDKDIWKYIDFYGKELTSRKYDDLGDFKNGFAKVKLNFKYGYINETGKEISPIIYDSVYDFSCGLARVYRNYKYGFINQNGQEIIEVKYYNARDCSENLCAVRDGSKWGFITTEGKEALPIKYEDAGSFKDSIARVKINGKWGFINKEGKEVIEAKYDDLKDFNEDYAPAKLNGLWGIIDRDGEVSVPFRYYFLDTLDNGLLSTCNNATKCFDIDVFGNSNN